MDSKHSDDDYIINDTEYEEDEADIAFDKQEKSKKKGSVIRRIILIICIIVFCVSAGMLIKILLEYKKGSDIYKDVQSEVLDDNTPVTVEMPEGEVEIPFKYNHPATCQAQCAIQQNNSCRPRYSYAFHIIHNSKKSSRTHKKYRHITDAPGCEFEIHHKRYYNQRHDWNCPHSCS